MRPIVTVSADQEIIELVQSLGQRGLVGMIDPDPDAQALGLPILGGNDDWPRIRNPHPGRLGAGVKP